MTKTLEMVQLLRYRDGARRIEAAHKSFFSKGEAQLKMEEFKTHVAEHKENYHNSMDPDHLREYLELLFEQENGWQKVLDMLDYILVVEGKYLQMMTIYALYNKDGLSLEGLYETFNYNYQTHSNNIANFLKQKVPTFKSNITPADLGHKKIKVKMERFSWLYKLIVSGDLASMGTLERLSNMQILTAEIMNSIDEDAVITESRLLKGGRKWTKMTPLKLIGLTFGI